MDRTLRLVIPVVCAAFSSIASAQFPLEYYLPAGATQGKVIRHGAYILQFNEQARQPDWVIYELTNRRAVGALPATGTFRADPNVRTGAVGPDDYKGSGYDRGQLVFPGDMRWSKSALDESFLMSTVNPMKPAFVKGLWAEAGAFGRKIAVSWGSVYIVAGPVLKGTLDTVGKTGIPAPRWFFRILVDLRETDVKGIGFLLPADGRKKPLMECAVPIDSVEAVTGIDFFPNLPDAVEKMIEGTVDSPRWAAVDSLPGSSSGKPGMKAMSGKGFTPAVLCKGVTKEGKPCMRMTTNPNGYCWEHQDQANKAAKPAPKPAAKP